MNFAAFSAVGAGGTHFVTTGGQMPVAKLQQNNGNPLSQVHYYLVLFHALPHRRSQEIASCRLSLNCSRINPQIQNLCVLYF